jgi:hypothetical protein
MVFQKRKAHEHFAKGEFELAESVLETTKNSFKELSSKPSDINLIQYEDDSGFLLLEKMHMKLTKDNQKFSSDNVEQAIGASKAWRCGKDLRNDLTLLCRNVGNNIPNHTNLPRCRCAIPSLQEKSYEGKIPPIDVEVSQDDTFYFEVELPNNAVSQNYNYEWTAWKSSRRKRLEWESISRRALSKHGAEKWQHRFSSSGIKAVSVKVTHSKQTTRTTKKFIVFSVEASRQRKLVQHIDFLRKWEVAFAIAFASLIGLMARYYSIEVNTSSVVSLASASSETFGSGADYLLAFLWGVAAQTSVMLVQQIPSTIASAWHALTPKKSS